MGAMCVALTVEAQSLGAEKLVLAIFFCYILQG